MRSTTSLTALSNTFALPMHRLGEVTTRIGLAVVFGWIGVMKFTAYEAEAISGLVSSSPLTSWLYTIASQQAISSLIGMAEIIAALLLLLGFLRPVVGALGGVLIAATLVVTISFLLTAPVVEPSLGAPALNVLPGQFLLKDLALFGAALWLIAHDIAAVGRQNSH